MSTDQSPATHQRQDNRERLTFTRIEVARAPGINPGYTIGNLSPDINIVFGPNASGKSTTARAIQSLIWPHPNSLRGHQLRANFSLGDENWQIEADAGRVTRRLDGEVTDPPALAPIDDRARYTLGLHDLLASENQPLAQAILKESSGGFDLDALAGEQGYQTVIPPRLEAARDVDAALARLRDAERAQSEVVSQAGQLPVLREREQTARKAQGDAEAFRRALQLARVRHDLDGARQELAAFPQELAFANGDEVEQVAALNERLSELSVRRAELERNRERAIADVQATHLRDQAINEGVVQAIRDTREAIRTIDGELEALQRDLTSAIAERQSHQRRLAADLSDAQIASLDTEGIRELAGLSHAYEEIRVRRRARDEVEHWIGGVTPPGNVETLREGVDILSKRIQTPNREEASALIGKARMAAYIGGALTIAGAIWLANFVDPLWILFAIFGILVIYFAWKYALPESVKEAALWEQKYRDLALPEPASWTTPAVRERLTELQGQLRLAEVEQEKAERWVALEHERGDLDRAYAETDARRAHAVAQYGVAPDLGEDSLRLLAENLSRWQAADTAVRSTEARLNQVGGERLRRESSLRQEMQTFGYDDDDWDEHIEDLDQRYRALLDATSRADTNLRELESAIAPEIERYEQSRGGIFQRVGLLDGHDAELRKMIAQLPAYREAQKRIIEREDVVRDASDALALTPHLRDVDAETLHHQMDDAEATAADLDHVQQEISEIQTRINDASRKHDVEEALVPRDNAMNTLRAGRSTLETQIGGSTLLGYIQQETRDAAMPIVFHRARELFSIITRGKYELEFEEGPPPAFTAYDTTAGMFLHLDQLSSGTRVQVLMAIRLAFVENVETGPKLPLLLDETLGNSDELRAGAIIDAAIEISRKGRQVFYFTAQGDEVARWKARLDQIPEVERPEVSIIDLAEIRQDAGFERIPMILSQAPVDRLSVPSPDGLDRETYGTVIKAPGIDVWSEGTGGIHVWHLIDDLPALHGLLEQDIRTWGQLSGIVRSSGTDCLSRIGVDGGVWDAAEARSRLLETAIAMWRIGRGRPVMINDVAESGIVDQDKLNELRYMLDEVGHDAAALLERLQSSGDAAISGKALDRIETWLIGKGYVAQGEPMSSDDIRVRMIQASRDDLRRGLVNNSDIDEILMQLPG